MSPKNSRKSPINVKVSAPPQETSPLLADEKFIKVAKTKKAPNQQASPFKKPQAGFVGLEKVDLQQLHLNNLPPVLVGIWVLIGSIAIVDSY